MRHLLRKATVRRILTLILLLFISFTHLLTFQQQAVWADPPSQSLSAEEKLQRAYDVYDQDAGMREEIYQQKMREQQDAEKVPRSLERIQDLRGKDVPETSVVETAVSKVKQLLQSQGQD